MSGLAGWINFSTDNASPHVIDRMGAQLARFDGSPVSILRGKKYAVAQATHDRTCDVYHGGDDTVIVTGHPRFSDSVLENRVRAEGRARTLLAVFRDRGPAFLKNVQGKFSLAIVLGTEKLCLLAVDRIGSHSLSYAPANNGIVFGSNAAVINLHPAISHEIDSQQIYNYLYFHMIPGPGSIFREHVRLEPGCFVQLSDTSVQPGRYWEIQYTRETESIPFSDLKNEFREILRTSIKQELSDQKTGAFLSGGTDSSTVAGMICETTQEPAHTYSIGFDAQGYDETYYARIAARYFQTRHHEYFVTPKDILDAIPLIAQIHAEPYGNSSAVPTYYCARMAKSDGIAKLLAGDGGDELFGGNSRYATQRLFSLYSDLHPVLRKNVIEPIVFSVPMGERLFPVRKLRSYIRQASLPMPARMETYNLLDRFGPETVLTQGFLRTVDTAQPLSMLTSAYNQAHAVTMLNRMLAVDLKFTLADNDLPKVNRSAELASVQVGYPLLSDELVEFAARLPARLKLRGTKLRYFFKEALRDFLPHEIITKKKHGFGLPVGPWIQGNRALRELASDSLSSLKNREIVRPDFIDTLLNKHLPTHPGFYGTMVWLLMMLEHWYKYHADTKN